MSSRTAAKSAASHLVRKPSRLLWLAPLLMAMEGPGCVVSENALTRPERGFVDADLLGDWAYDESPGEIAFRVSQRDDRTIEVRWYVEDSGEFIVLTGFVAEVNGRNHANLQFVGAGCDGCAAEATARFQQEFERDFADVVPGDPDNRCTWATVSYESLDESRLLIGTLSPRAVLDLIEGGALQGEFDTHANGADASRVVCITESRRGLRRFVDELGFDGPVMDSELLVRYGD